MSSLDTLSTYLRWDALLVIWADLPWEPIDRLPVARAVAIGRMRGEARALQPIDWPLPDLPPLPILSLDPSARVAQTFRQAGKPLREVRSLRHVPVAGQHNLLQLGGDLGKRQGLLLTREDVAALRTDGEARHLLAEAAHVCKHGAVLILRPMPSTAFDRMWTRVLAPALGSVSNYGLGPGPWPAGIETLDETPAQIFAALSQVERGLSVDQRHSPEVEALFEERAQRLRRLWALQEASDSRPHDVDLKLQIENETSAIALLDRKLEAALDEGRD